MVGWYRLIPYLLNWDDYVVMRVVVRQGFSRDMADMLLGDIKNAITELEKLDYPTPTRMAQEKNLPVELKCSITVVKLTKQRNN